MTDSTRNNAPTVARTSSALNDVRRATGVATESATFCRQPLSPAFPTAFRSIASRYPMGRPPKRPRPGRSGVAVAGGRPRELEPGRERRAALREALDERSSLAAVAWSGDVAAGRCELGADREPDRAPRGAAELEGDGAHPPAQPGQLGLHGHDLVEIERERERRRAAAQVARGDRARRGLVGDEQHALASSEVDDADLVPVGGASGVVGGHAGPRGDEPPLRPGLATARLRPAIGDGTAQRHTERGVARLVEQLEGRAVRGAVGGELGIGVSHGRTWIPSLDRDGRPWRHGRRVVMSLVMTGANGAGRIDLSAGTPCPA